MNYLTLNEVIAEALSITPDLDDQDWSFARQWAVTALMQLGTSEDEINVCTLTCKNYTMKKPDDMRAFIELALYDAQDKLIPHAFRAGKKRVFPATSQLIDGIVIPYEPVDVSEDQYAFYIGSNGEQVAYAKVRYFAYPLDKDGTPMIRLDEKPAIMYYIRWCKSMKKNENQSEIAQNEQRWKWEFDRVRAKKKTISKDKAEVIARNWVRLLPNFNTRQF